MKRKLVIIFVAIFFIISLNSCSLFFGKNTIKNLKFKIDGISAFRMNGFDISEKNTFKDFGAEEVIRFMASYNMQKIPVEFMLRLKILNPNDGNSGTQRITCTLTKLDWKLFLNDNELISGITETPSEITPGGHGITVPIRVSANLFKVLNFSNAESAVNIILSLGGIKGSPEKLKLEVQPTVSTIFGEITYPEKITVINKSFN
ncbi:MAG: hypothetical protein NT007_11290 [Candidatus Kapabacteria bacterium]|nr:hypothetical protein [Candidatus Kapabacteria bacterium]